MSSYLQKLCTLLIGTMISGAIALTSSSELAPQQMWVTRNSFFEDKMYWPDINRNCSATHAEGIYQ
jgi:hypothetical protein